MKKTLILFVIIITVTVVVTYQYPYKSINPGELSQGHQNLNNKCLSCHRPFQGISNNKCISCHKLTEIGFDKLLPVDAVSNTKKVLFHESFTNQDCIACHTDHKGIDPKLSLSKFEHSLLQKPVLNNCVSCHKTPENELHKQLSTDCKSCHTTTDWKASKTFNHELISTETKNNCTSCHTSPQDSFHQSAQTNCNECHTTNKWLPSTFNHSSFFKLDRDHSPNKCNTCHVDNNFKTYSCYGCHEHSQANIRGEHLEEGIKNFQNCVLCHKSGDEHDIRKYNNATNKNYDSKKRKPKKHDDD